LNAVALSAIEMPSLSTVTRRLFPQRPGVLASIRSTGLAVGSAVEPGGGADVCTSSRHAFCMPGVEIRTTQATCPPLRKYCWIA